MASMNLIFRFLGVDDGAGAEFDRMAGKAEFTSKAVKGLALGVAGAAVGIGVASVKLAADFQTSMERVHTQANASNHQVAMLSKGILDMAGAVAETPNTLAAAAYHIASVGQKSLTTAQQLQILRIATEGAKIGGANLVDVTNALDAAIVSHIKGVNNYSQAMGVLNATVGAGDMQMQDLAEAFGPLGAVLKGYNVNIRQAGAALATFGDNNVRGAHAGTALRMAVQALAVPTVNGAAQLQAWGIQAGNLSKQLENGGLTSALDKLMQVMRANGVTAKDQGTILTEAFGKRAGIGLSVLEGELGRYHDKLKEVTQGANGFASSWKGYTSTFGYALDSAKGAAEGLLIQLGQKLLPTVTKLTLWISQKAIPALGQLGAWFGKNKIALYALVAGLAALGLAFGGPITVIGILGAGLVLLWTKCGTFRDIVKTAIADVGVAFTWLQGQLGFLSDWWNAHFSEIKQVATETWRGLVEATKVAWPFIKNTVVTDLKVVWDVIRTTVHVVADLVGFVLDILTGHWAKAWGDAKKLVSDAFHGIGSIIHDFAKGALTMLYQAGKDILQGLVNGIKAQMGPLYSVVHGIAGTISNVLHGHFKFGSPSKVTYQWGVWLAEGLINGWTGQATRLKDALSTSVQDAMSHLQSVLASRLSALQAQLKTAQSNLASFMSGRHSAISGLSSSLAAGPGLSSLFGTDANGNPTVGNADTYLAGQAASLKKFAQDLKWAEGHGLAPALISQIAQMGAQQGDQILQQFMSGQSSVAQANAYERTIQQASGAAARGVVDTPAELRMENHLRAVVAWDRMLVKEQERTNHILERRAARQIALHITVDGKGKITDEQTKEIVKAIRRLEHNTGISL